MKRQSFRMSTHVVAENIERATSQLQCPSGKAGSSIRAIVRMRPQFAVIDSPSAFATDERIGFAAFADKPRPLQAIGCEN